MGIKKFTKEVVSIMPSIHTEIVRRQPTELMKGKISFSQMVIIDMLRTRGECKMGDISRPLGVTKSAVTGMTDRLIRAGLLRRSRSRLDRRVVKIKLTGKGINLSKRFYNSKLKIIRNLFSNISERERAQYLNIMQKLHRNISAKKRL